MEKGWRFSIWASGEKTVSLCGDFNNWKGQSMNRTSSGVWYTEVKEAESGQCYKFYIKCQNELHVGSWKRRPGGEWYTYAELEQELLPWILEKGFTHIELLPLVEHPLDNSWGYQTTGSFSLTSRYGSPEQFAHFVDACHNENIGVIMDYVPVHFCANEGAISRLDGTPLYEHNRESETHME